MNKRIADKIYKRAVEKILSGEQLTQKERITFRVYMERWLGPEIVTKIKNLGKADRKNGR